ncbi:glycosyltransferase [Flavobacterium salilacus subsp. salilacus]|uniref:glycosyltransferase n=1 Tax=Flavobacterium TaxID=237 RepID=UPI001075837A|nr:MULTISPECIES: glycosyltransferase [Flavobacterium]KAF2519765.1 glycosyltransferase [Flavobacterium salilacus subsp. salilacus]MBE1614340.1 glycosyltransferase [Flavobacterium sp. SaA2.13]
MSNKKKVLFIISTLNTGGAETVLINLLNLFDFESYEVDLCVILKKGVLLEKVPPQVKVQHLAHSDLYYRTANYLYGKYNNPILVKTLARKLKGSYDTVFCFLDGVFTDYVFMSNLKYNAYYTVVQSSYSNYKQKTKYLTASNMKRATSRYEKVDGIIASSQSIKDDFEAFFGKNDKIRVIFNPINLNKVLEMANQGTYSHPDSAISIVAIGRLIPIKGFENLIKAAAILKDRNKSFHIHIIGKGPLENDLNALITELKVEKYVTLHGFVENPYPIIKNSDIYIIPSYSEGLPTAPIEAAILGRPLVATNVSGCREVIDNGKYGIMVEPEGESIANGLEKLIDSEDLRKEYAELALTRAKFFDDETAMQQYYSLIGNNKN